MGALPIRCNEGNDPPFLTDLRHRYLSIPVSTPKAIINNTLFPVNIMKLSINYSKEKSEKEKEADCKSSDMKEMTHLIRAFLLYCTILIRITRLEVQQPLTFALLKYCDRFLAYSVHYTLDSIKEFHFTFQNKRIATGVTDPMGWAQIDQYLVDLHLRKRQIVDPQLAQPRHPYREPAQGTVAGPSSSTRSATGNTFRGYGGAGKCIRYNSGHQCQVEWCRYTHSCALCHENHPATQCPTIGPPAQPANSVPQAPPPPRGGPPQRGRRQ